VRYQVLIGDDDIFNHDVIACIRLDV
jgi:hypothetical protein